MPTVTDIRIGTDLVYIPRLHKVDKRFGDAFFTRLLTPVEWQYCLEGGEKRKLKRAAARIAVKEAVAKALGCGLNGMGWGQGIHWHEVTVRSYRDQPPDVLLTGAARHNAQQLGIHTWRVSFSHDGDYATATVTGLQG